MQRAVSGAKRTVRTGLVVAAAVGLAGAALVGGCGDKGRQRPSTEVVPLQPQSFTRAWKAELDLKEDSLEDLYLEGDRLFAYTRNHDAYVMSAAGGTLAAVTGVNATGGVLREPVIMPDKVVYPTGITLEIHDVRGQLVKSMSLPYPTRSRGLASGNTIYIGLDYPTAGRLAAIDVTRQYNIMRWELMTRGAVSARPAIFEKVVYIGSEDGRVYAVDEDRNPVWPLDGSVYVTGGRIVADLKVDDFGVYIASTDSKLYCVDRLTGKTKWQFFAGAALQTSPLVTADSVYLYVPGRGVVAIDKTTGKFNRDPRWTVEDARQFLSADERFVYLRLRDDQIVAVDKASGEQRFASKGKDYELFVSNTQNNTIYAAQKNGLVAAIKPVLTPGTVGEVVRLDEQTLQLPVPLAASAE
jgi:outer membrane protein assembly factor BamB